jgi:hypothetical protein
MSETINFHSLFVQLQTRYPAASLITELVQMQGDRAIVRAIVQVNGFTLATGMAAAATVELAEDQARLRVLSVLGITSGMGSGVSFPTLTTPLGLPGNFPSPRLASDREDTGIDTLSSNGGLSTPTPPLPRPAKSLPTFPPLQEIASDGEGDDHPIAQPFESVALEDLQPPVPNKPVRREPPLSDVPPELEPDFLAEESSAPREPVDLSELIALTDVEMERIGWSKKRGQNHLKRTYGRQTRAELSEDQLLEFLHFLRALPSQLAETKEE